MAKLYADTPAPAFPDPFGPGSIKGRPASGPTPFERACGLADASKARARTAEADATKLRSKLERARLTIAKLKARLAG